MAGGSDPATALGGRAAPSLPGGSAAAPLAGSTAPLMAFRIRGWEAEDAADELSRSVFAITEVDRDANALRVSVGAWNVEDELGRFVERVADLAAHTPETLPRKPALMVISAPQPDPSA